MLLKKNLVLFLLSAILVSGCSVGKKSVVGAQAAVPGSLAILGVTVFPEIETGQNPQMMTNGLRELLKEAGQYRTLRSSNVKMAMEGIQKNAYETLIDTYAKTGALSGDALNILRATRLPVEYALIARVEQNSIKNSAKLEPLRNLSGVVLTDRERKVLITEREVQMSAAMLNLATGEIVWSRAYRSAPQTKSAFVRYSGSSFSGTLAASLVNTMTTGLKEPDWPAPASYQLTVQSLMREIVRNMPAS